MAQTAFMLREGGTKDALHAGGRHLQNEQRIAFVPVLILLIILYFTF